MARDMYGPMTGASAWMMTPRWDAPHLLLLWAMWAVMMTGMMLPSAAPMVLLAGDGASAPTCSRSAISSVWTRVQRRCHSAAGRARARLVLTPMMEVSGARLARPRC